LGQPRVAVACRGDLPGHAAVLPRLLSQPHAARPAPPHHASFDGRALHADRAPCPFPLRCQVGAWALGALQLRSGFPPRADFEGGGRQRFLFFAKADAAHMVGFYVFQVLTRGGQAAYEQRLKNQSPNGKGTRETRDKHVARAASGACVAMGVLI
jgi:hypothetical protein